MYKLYRDIHLGLGLVVTPLLLIYAISSVLLAYDIINPSKTQHTITKFKVSKLPNSSTDTDKLLKVRDIKCNPPLKNIKRPRWQYYSRNFLIR